MQKPGPGEEGKKREVRCAVYTRKSTTEGLQQEFNTLDAQRESCEKFVESQKGEGWRVLPERYDDGGFTGGNMDRPALKKLLHDIRQKKVDCVVVYKVDRLSRSLMDFAQLVQVFEGHNVVFVSVTQQFSTHTSMGRLTLNVLLSFAQFEREIISERIRDKMAAARQKGKWMGGTPPLGYDVPPEGKKLVVNPAEAELVREIFGLYLEKKSLKRVVRTLNERGRTAKRRVSRAGKLKGGGPFRLSHVQHVLRNPLYMGKMPQGGQLYPGAHEAILAEEVFLAAERLRAENRNSRVGPATIGPPPLLKGLLRCRSCACSMFHTYARKWRKSDGKQYRYYLCSRAMRLGRDLCPAPSVNAEAIEGAAITCLKQALDKYESLKAFFATSWEVLFPAEQVRVFRAALERLEYDGAAGTLHLTLNERGIEDLLRETTPAREKV